MKREIREQRLHDLVERYVAQLARREQNTPSDLCVELIAHSPESPIAQAVAARLPELTAAGVTVRAVFVLLTPEPMLASWLAQVPWVRCARDKRLLEAHEQLVLGRTRCWSGDAMRRGAVKTDLFESLNEGSEAAAILGRQAFDKLSPFAAVIRPRRITASLSAAPQARAQAFPQMVDSLRPAPDSSLDTHPLVTRH